MSAAGEYKDVIGELTTAAEALRERDRVRAAHLTRELREVGVSLERAEERAALSRLGVELQWDVVVEALWDESWMTLRPHPQPDSTADADALDTLDAAADRAATAEQDAVRRRTFGFGR